MKAGLGLAILFRVDSFSSQEATKSYEPIILLMANVYNNYFLRQQNRHLPKDPVSIRKMHTGSR